MEPIKRVPIVSQVEESIREMIEKKEYKPGMKLPTEFEFCQTLQVGRGTVREALRLLQAKGLVEIKPGRGAVRLRRMSLRTQTPSCGLFRTRKS